MSNLSDESVWELIDGIKELADEILVDVADFVHVLAEERCTELKCGWNSTRSDEPSQTRHYYQQIDVDDFKKLDKTYQACPWCDSETEKKA